MELLSQQHKATKVCILIERNILFIMIYDAHFLSTHKPAANIIAKNLFEKVFALEAKTV